MQNERDFGIPADRSSEAVVVLATLLALGVRLLIVIPAPFPLNDGGLFYVFIMDLLENGLRLPVFSTYNSAAIPLAYPPLAFYLTAILHLASRVPVLELLRIAPAFLSVASIPAFYLLAAEILGSPRRAALAALVFSMLPRTFDWLIMGGGITRSLGLLLGLLVMWLAVYLFAHRGRRAILPIIVLGSLLVCSHPEASLHTILTAALLYLWYDRTTAGLRDAAIIALGIMALSAIWWVPVLFRHGLAPFSAAAAAARADSYNPLVGLLALFRFDFSDEPGLRIFAVLGLLGLMERASHRQYLLPVWIAILHTFEPRGGTLFMMIPLAMGAGIFLDAVVMPSLDSGRVSSTHASATSVVSEGSLPRRLSRIRASSILLALLVVYGSVAAYTVGSRIRGDLTLSDRDLEAFEWVRGNTLPSSRFALVTEARPLRDATSEWFPALAQRKSIATVFGMEWVESADFADQIERNDSLQDCLGGDAACLQSWSQSHGEPFDFVYIRPTDVDLPSPLQLSLAQSADFVLVYEDGGLVIYQAR